MKAPPPAGQFGPAPDQDACRRVRVSDARKTHGSRACGFPARPCARDRAEARGSHGSGGAGEDRQLDARPTSEPTSRRSNRHPQRIPASAGHASPQSCESRVTCRLSDKGERICTLNGRPAIIVPAGRHREPGGLPVPGPGPMYRLPPARPSGKSRIVGPRQGAPSAHQRVPVHAGLAVRITGANARAAAGPGRVMTCLPRLRPEPVS
jgi:hypothetical protein